MEHDSHSDAKTFTIDDYVTLAMPFGDEFIKAKIQSATRDKSKNAWVAYIERASVVQRLNQVDPAWVFESDPAEQISYGMFGGKVHVDEWRCRGRLTVKGVTRTNEGADKDPKSAQTDAFKRCAVLFGVGEFLYNLDVVYLPENVKWLKLWRDVQAKTGHASGADSSTDSGTDITVDLRANIGHVLMLKNEQDKNAAIQELEELTAFTTKDGQDIPGVTSAAKLTDGRARTTWGRMKKMTEYQPYILTVEMG